MERKIILVLLLSLFPVTVISQSPNVQVKKDAALQFRISRTGLEAADPKKVVLLTEMDEYYDENSGASKIGLTEEMIRKECESRLGEAGLEPLSGFARPEYLSVKVSVKFRSYHIALQFIRPVSYQVEGTQIAKYGAITWQRTILGQHGYSKAFVLESLGTLLEEFTKEYLKANSK